MLLWEGHSEALIGQATGSSCCASIYQVCISLACCTTTRSHLVAWLQGVLQKAPDAVPTGADFSQTLCFCEEAVQAEMRRRVAQAKLGEPQVDSVAEWLNRDCVVLVNDGQFVQPASASSGRRTGDKVVGAVAALRPITAAV